MMFIFIFFKSPVFFFIVFLDDHLFGHVLTTSRVDPIFLKRCQEFLFCVPADDTGSSEKFAIAIQRLSQPTSRWIPIVDSQLDLST